MTEMRGNSSDIMSGLRWVLHGITMLWLCILLVIGDNDLLGKYDSMAIQSRPTLWIASLYALMFGSETWLRLRGRMPSALRTS
jgi:hypothetical protein